MPAIHGHAWPREIFGLPGWVYIMTNRSNGTLYVGVTDDLARRAWEHRAGLVEGFTKQYGLTRLVFSSAIRKVEEAASRSRAPIRVVIESRQNIRNQFHSISYRYIIENEI